MLCNIQQCDIESWIEGKSEDMKEKVELLRV